MCLADLSQHRHRRRVAGVVHCAQGLGAGANPGRGVLRIDAEIVLPQNLGEYRTRTAVAGRRGRRDERDAGHDHLISRPNAGCQIGEMQRGGGAARGHGVLHAEVPRELRLEGLDARAHRKPT